MVGYTDDELRALSFLDITYEEDRQTNQGIAPYTPSGWVQTMLEALEACVIEVNRFPYVGSA